jgi:hypothetical protein
MLKTAFRRGGCLAKYWTSWSRVATPIPSSVAPDIAHDLRARMDLEPVHSPPAVLTESKWAENRTPSKFADVPLIAISTFKLRCTLACRVTPRMVTTTFRDRQHPWCLHILSLCETSTIDRRRCFPGLRCVRDQIIYDSHAVISFGDVFRPIQDVVMNDVILVTVVGVWTCRNLRGAENNCCGTVSPYARI